MIAHAKNPSRMPRYDVETIKQAARSRGWANVHASLGGLPLDATNGKHQPCPKCGGKDRFRVFDDYAETGGMLCNAEGKFSDGIAALQWMLGCDFAEAIKQLADHLAVKPEKAKKNDPEKDLEFLPWASAAIPYFQSRRGVGEEALLAFGAQRARYKNRFIVIALPIYGESLDVEKPVGWVLMDATGGTLPKWDRHGNHTGDVKTKLTVGSKPGLVGRHALERLPVAGMPEIVWKCEGITDALALYAAIPAELRDKHLVLTNANGAQEDPKWMAGVLARGKPHVIHDADQPGEIGVKKWAKEITRQGVETTIVRLPYEIAENHGKDLRNWLEEGNTYDDLLELAKRGEKWTEEKAKAHEPQFSNASVVIFEGHESAVALSLTEIHEALERLTDGWPRRVGDCLFVDDPFHGIAWLPRTDSLFGWLRRRATVSWHGGNDMTKRNELFCELQRTAQAYESVEKLPHFPPLPGSYYATAGAKPGDGTSLQALLDRFTPSTTIDRDLIEAMLVTLFWGGRPGARPAFVLTSAAGRGAGKTTLAEMLGEVAGGFIAIDPGEDIGKLKERLLSPEALGKRVALLDNVKKSRFGWGELEALITSPTISGRRLYVGEGSRPNVLTWVVTVNGPSLSADLAQRSAIIELDRASYSGTWKAETQRFIDDHRNELLADVAAFFERDRHEIEQYSRWSAWEFDVLTRLPEPAEAQRVILERQAAVDADQDEASIIEEHVAGELCQLGYDPQTSQVRIPTAVMARWYGEATGEQRVKTQGVTRKLKQMAGEGQLKRLSPDAGRAHGRSFIFTGEHADTIGEAIDNDLSERLDITTAKQGKRGSF